MSAPRKVAFVSAIPTAYAHRLVRGALSYSEQRSHAVIRDFRIPYKLPTDGSPVAILGELSDWQPDGLLSFMGNNLLTTVLAILLPRRCPVVSVCQVEIKPGIAVVTASFASNLEIAVRHF